MDVRFLCCLQLRCIMTFRDTKKTKFTHCPILMKHNFPEVKIAEDPDQLNRSFNLKSSPPPPPKKSFPSLQYSFITTKWRGDFISRRMKRAWQRMPRMKIVKYITQNAQTSLCQSIWATNQKKLTKLGNPRRLSHKQQLRPPAVADTIVCSSSLCYWAEDLRVVFSPWYLGQSLISL